MILGWQEFEPLLNWLRGGRTNSQLGRCEELDVLDARSLVSGCVLQRDFPKVAVVALCQTVSEFFDFGGPTRLGNILLAMLVRRERWESNQLEG